jgi:hypothetical protein
VPIQQAIAITIHVRQPGIVPFHAEVIILVGLTPGCITISVAVHAIEYVHLIVVALASPLSLCHL